MGSGAEGKVVEKAIYTFFRIKSLSKLASSSHLSLLIQREKFTVELKCAEDYFNFKDGSKNYFKAFYS